MPLRVLIADDHEPFRRALEHLLDSEPDVRVVAYAGDGSEAIRQAEALQPDIVLMDIDMPGADGLAATRWIVRHLPKIMVVLMASEGSSEYYRAAAESGAAGLLVKEWAGDNLLTLLRALLQHVPA